MNRQFPYITEDDIISEEINQKRGIKIVEVNFDNLTKEEQEQFTALVEKANKQNNKPWKPEVGERFYYIMSNDATIDYFAWRGDEADEAHYNIGNCFRTEEEAEFALERLKVIAEMSRYLAEHDDVGVDWSVHSKVKYGLCYNYDEDSPFVAVTYNIGRGGLYAGDSIVMENMIKEIGEDRIKKYYFGVE